MISSLPASAGSSETISPSAGNFEDDPIDLLLLREASDCHQSCLFEELAGSSTKVSFESDCMES